ncbi:MAG: radical SAM protein [Deltaproteobacteria bacterium]|nr:radical SAM protein [Deltaproteobacteria bacterium]
MPNLDEQLRQARDISWKRFGRRLTVYLPGMFSYSGLSGDYPAVSITGSDCALQCDHCRGIILEPMVSAMEPDILVQKGLGIAKKGNQGILISGGCDQGGRLPWKRFIPAIKEIKKKTELYISIHCGLVDEPVASDLKGAGVDQALIDVIGDDETYQRIYHVNFGISRIEDSMGSLQKAGIPIVPHIVCGLHFGEIRGERKAIEMISRFHVEQVVIVSLMTIPGTPLWGVHTPEPEEIAHRSSLKHALRCPGSA